MFPLAGKAFPKTDRELTDAIRGALLDVFTLSKSDNAVAASGGAFPELKKLTIDLDGARVSATEPPPKPTPTGKRTPGISVGQLEVSGQPIHYEKAKVNLHLKAKNVQLDFAKDKAGHPMLVLTDAAEGQAEAKIAADDLRAIVLAVAAAGAKEHGVTIQDVEIQLTSEGKRSVAAVVRVTARKSIVKGVVRLTGRADVDDALNATVSDLSCQGEGMIGKMAAGFLAGKLEEFNGRQFPLMTFSLGDVKLRDLKVDAKNGLQVTAKFGSKA
ncbi:MAG TPA: hypothetical protein VF624_02745 [Tepidisphaeraceae bacterium]|jgi:hypothetical protein